MNKNCEEQNRQFDIVWLIRYFWAKRWLIAKCVGTSVILCIVVCLVKSKQFTVTASIMPVVEGSGMSGGVGALASMAGIDFSSGSGGNIITPDLYPKVAQSTPFLLKVMDVKVPWIGYDSLMSTYEHAKVDTVPTFQDLLVKYTIGLPGTIVNLFSSDEKVEENVEETRYVTLNKKQRDVIQKLQKAIVVEEDPIYGTVEISVSSESAIQSSILANSVINLLQETVTEHRTRRAKLVYAFLQERYSEALMEYEAVRAEFNGYRDTHRNMVAERVDAEYQRLSDQYQLSYSILKSLSTQLEQSKLEIMENTPVFSVVEPVVVPEKKSSPRLSIHIIVGFVLGFVGSVGWLLCLLAWLQVFREEQYLALYAKYK